MPAASVSPSVFLTTAQAAAFLGLTAQCLRRKRCTNDGPPFVRLGNGPSSRCAYRMHPDLEEWIKARTTLSAPPRAARPKAR